MKKKKAIIFIDELKSGNKLIDVFHKLKININLIICDFSLKEKINKSVFKTNKFVFINLEDRQDKSVYDLLSKEKDSILISFLIKTSISTKIIKLYYKSFYLIAHYDLKKYGGKYASVMPLICEDTETCLGLYQFGKDFKNIYIINRFVLKLDNNKMTSIVYEKILQLFSILFKNFDELIIINRKLLKKEKYSRNINIGRNLPNNGYIDWNWEGRYIVKFVKFLNISS